MTGYNPADEGAQMSFAKDMSYTDYLSLDPILGAQNCKSDAHDEMLFIIQHQKRYLDLVIILKRKNGCISIKDGNGLRWLSLSDSGSLIWDRSRPMLPHAQPRRNDVG